MRDLSMLLDDKMLQLMAEFSIFRAITIQNKLDSKPTRKKEEKNC